MQKLNSNHSRASATIIDRQKLNKLPLITGHLQAV